MTKQELAQALATLELNVRQAAKRFGVYEGHMSRMLHGQKIITKRMEIQVRDVLEIADFHLHEIRLAEQIKQQEP